MKGMNGPKVPSGSLKSIRNKQTLLIATQKIIPFESVENSTKYTGKTKLTPMPIQNMELVEAGSDIEKPVRKKLAVLISLQKIMPVGAESSEDHLI